MTRLPEIQVKTTPKSILKFTAIAFLVVTPLAMAMLQIPDCPELSASDYRNTELRVSTVGGQDRSVREADAAGEHCSG